MTDETSGQIPASPNDKEKEIQQLINEKKALEEKNKRLASILEITAKNASKLKTLEGMKAEKETPLSGDIVSSVASIKKEIGTLERKIEKSKAVQSSEQLNTVLAEIKSRFEKVDERLNVLDKIITLEKKLSEIEDSITLHKKSSSNLFGGLGTIGGGNPEGPENETDGVEEIAGPSDDFGKLDEINLKIDALTKKVETIQAGGEKHSFSDNLKKIISFGGDSEERKEDIIAIQQKMKESESLDAGDIPGISFRKIDDAKSSGDDESHGSFTSSIKGIKDIGSADDIKFKVHTPEHFSDFGKIPDDIRSGHVVLLNVKSLKDESVDELRHFIEKIKRISDGISAKIMGIGEHHIIVLPKKIDTQNP